MYSTAREKSCPRGTALLCMIFLLFLFYSCAERKCADSRKLEALLCKRNTDNGNAKNSAYNCHPNSHACTTENHPYHVALRMLLIIGCYSFANRKEGKSRNAEICNTEGYANECYAAKKTAEPAHNAVPPTNQNEPNKIT